MSTEDIEAEVRALDRQLPGRISLGFPLAVTAVTLAGAAAIYWLWPYVLGAAALAVGVAILGAWASK